MFFPRSDRPHSWDKRGPQRLVAAAQRTEAKATMFSAGDILHSPRAAIEHSAAGYFHNSELGQDLRRQVAGMLQYSESTHTAPNAQHNPVAETSAAQTRERQGLDTARHAAGWSPPRPMRMNGEASQSPPPVRLSAAVLNQLTEYTSLENELFCHERLPLSSHSSDRAASTTASSTTHVEVDRLSMARQHSPLGAEPFADALLVMDDLRLTEQGHAAPERGR